MYNKVHIFWIFFSLQALCEWKCNGRQLEVISDSNFYPETFVLLTPSFVPGAMKATVRSENKEGFKNLFTACCFNYLTLTSIQEAELSLVQSVSPEGQQLNDVTSSI